MVNFVSQKIFNFFVSPIPQSFELSSIQINMVFYINIWENLCLLMLQILYPIMKKTRPFRGSVFTFPTLTFFHCCSHHGLCVKNF